MKHIYKISFTLTIILLVMGSCKMGKNYSRPEMNSPQEFRFSEGDTTFNNSLKWWAVFDDPILDTLIKTALENNYDVLATAEKVQAAMFQLSIQKAELLPKFGVTGQAQRGNFNFMKTDSPTNNFVIGAQASWELDFWGKYRRLNEAAKAQYLGSEYGLSSLKLSLVTAVATTYFQILEYKEKQYISESTYAIRDSSLNLIQQRFDAGIIPEIDLNHAQIQRAIAATSIPLYKRLAAHAESTLSVLLGENPKELISSTKLEDITTIPEIPVGIPADILERRPDVLLAEQELVAQNAMIGVAQANRFPSFSLTGMLGGASDDLSTLTSAGAAWNVGGSLLGPLFHWNQNANRVKAERSKKEAAVYNYQNVALNAFKEVADLLIEISTLKEEEHAIQQHVKASLSATFLSSERYDKGIASYIEYLESQRQAFDAQIGLAENRQKLLSAHIKLYQALGGGWE